MNSFEELFRTSKGQPVIYNGQTIVLMDRLPVKDGSVLKLTFELAGSKWKQGVILRVDGSFEINARTINKSIALWHHTAPTEVSFRVNTRKGYVEVNNVWDTGDGSVQSWHNGAAMIVDEMQNGRRYRCNDGQPNDDFSDLVFRIEVQL